MKKEEVGWGEGGGEMEEVGEGGGKEKAEGGSGRE